MTNKTDIWMPLYVADYLSSTTRLTTEQHGAYLLLIIDYWKNGRLPDDDSILASITRLTGDAWAKHRGVLEGFFEVSNGEWIHSRIEKEIEKSGDLKLAQIKKSILGNYVKYGKIDPRVETDQVLKEWWAVASLNVSPKDSAKAPSSPSPSHLSKDKMDIAEPSVQQSSKADDCPHGEILALWTDVLPEATQPRIWTETRKKSLRSRWREDETRQELDWWRSFFGYIKQSDFLMGRVSGGSGKPFSIDLEWVCKESNFVKIIEGKYHNG